LHDLPRRNDCAFALNVVQFDQSAVVGAGGASCGLGTGTFSGGNVSRREVSYTYQLDHTLDRLSHGGLLLAATRSDGRSNAMTIGWGTVGVIWGLPVWVVLVRPSRFTYSFIQESGVFTVNVPTPEIKGFVTLCGTRSGRDVDKLAQVDTSMGQRVACVTLDDCPVVYECKVVHHNDVLPEILLPEIQSRAYPKGDFHRLYYGQIMGTWAE
jgi:flavin reductase (DIM6/NTAB) family NADH-FMN oxidoreductase RutF